MESVSLSLLFIAGFLFLIFLLVLGGAILFLKEGYQVRLGQGHTKHKAIVLALWDYLVADLLRQFVIGVFSLIAITLFIGGFIGLWIIGWQKLIEVFTAS